MKNHSVNQLIRLYLAALVLLFLVPGCSTLDYRSVQTAFKDAAADARGAGQENPLTQGTYQSVANQLTNGYIGKLDPKLQPNAWMLRSICEWELGKTTESRSSAEHGLAAKPEDGSRDHVVLSMMEGLCAEKDIMILYGQKNKKFSQAEYFTQLASDDPVERQYKTVINLLDRVKNTFSDSTPESTTYYYYYHRWRVVQNWREVVFNGIPDSAEETALENANAALGDTFSNVLKDAKARVPTTHWLHGEMQ